MKNITKYIISTNNNYYELRKYMLDNHFYLSKEIVIEEHHKYYPIMLFTKEYHKLTKISLKYGLSNNQEYFKYLLTKEKEIIANIPKYKLFTYIKHYQEIVILTKLIKEKN